MAHQQDSGAGGAQASHLLPLLFLVRSPQSRPLRQVLPEPCDPREPEYKTKCTPNGGLKALPGPDEVEGLGGKVFRTGGARPSLSAPGEAPAVASAAPSAAE